MMPREILFSYIEATPLAGISVYASRSIALSANDHRDPTIPSPERGRGNSRDSAPKCFVLKPSASRKSDLEGVEKVKGMSIRLI